MLESEDSNAVKTLSHHAQYCLQIGLPHLHVYIDMEISEALGKHF